MVKTDKISKNWTKLKKLDKTDKIGQTDNIPIHIPEIFVQGVP